MGSNVSKDTRLPVPPKRDSAKAKRQVRAALDAFRSIVQALRLAAGEGQRRSGVSAAQLFALQQIAEQPKLSINELALRTFTHQSSVSVVAQRLVERGLVAKIAAADDRRRHLLVLTAKGRRALQAAPAAMQHRLIRAFSALPAAERAVVARALAKVARRVAPSSAGRHPTMFFEDK